MKPDKLPKPFKLTVNSDIYWHNLLLDPEDLPELDWPLTYLCVLAFKEDIVESDKVMGYGIGECMYIPEVNKWYYYDLAGKRTYPNQKPIHDELIQKTYKLKEVSAEVVMWADCSSIFGERA